jgi:hypothetical protein
MANFSHGTLWPNDFFKWRVTQYLEGLPPSIQDKDAEIALLEAREVAWSQRVGQLEETIETLSKTYNL